MSHCSYLSARLCLKRKEVAAILPAGCVGVRWGGVGLGRGVGSAATPFYLFIHFFYQFIYLAKVPLFNCSSCSLAAEPNWKSVLDMQTLFVSDVNDMIDTSPAS